jgi:3-hydroxybutyrate dehydrogenase
VSHCLNCQVFIYFITKIYRTPSSSKVAIVTGSLSGIGLGIANALAKRGYNIILNGLTTQADLEKVEKHFATTFPKIKAKYIYADLTRPLDCKLLVRKTVEEFGRVDVLVNNAGNF